MRQFKLKQDLPGLKAGAVFKMVDGTSTMAIYCNQESKKDHDPHYDFQGDKVEGNWQWFEEIK